MNHTRKVTLLPEGKTFEVLAQTTVMEAVAQAGVTVTAPCGREGGCGKCRVEVTSGVAPPSGVEREALTAAQLASGVRLSCQARVVGDASVTVPAASRAADMRVLLGGVSRGVPFEPNVVKTAAELPEQTLENPVAKLEHLRRTMDLRADLRADLGLLRRMPGALEASGGRVTAVACGDRLIALEAGDTSGRGFGVALDLGTTTVVGALVDLTTGKGLGMASAVNRQTAYGHDVIGRINMTVEQADGLETLRRAALETLNFVVERLTQEAGVSREEVYEATVVGNATMVHLLLGVPPRFLGRLPYVAVVGDAVDLRAQEAGLGIHPDGRVYVLRNIARFVGADTVGAILASGLDEDDGRVRMMADIGTNCEIALRVDHRLIVCSTPAGPAFEGARIACGMYAAPGAIEEVKIDGDVRVKVIGGGAPRGLCGSGLVDVGAELLRAGVVDETGRMLGLGELDGRVSPALRQRVMEEASGLAFRVANGEGGEAIRLTQRDIRELQLAKGAIRTGIDLLLERAGLGVGDLDELCLAGGFGNYIDKRNAIRLGLIPDLPLERLRFIGNGALAGARMALVSTAMRRRGEGVAREAEHLQIAGTPDFQMRFSEAMLF